MERQGLILHFGARVLENLPDLSLEAMQRWNDNPTGLQDALRKALAGFFRTIKVGVKKLRNADDYREALAGAGCEISDWASDIMGKPGFKVADQEADVDFIVLSNAELGYKDGARYEDTCKRGVELGYDLCEPEDGPALRLSYLDQSKGEWLTMAMKPITGSGGGLGVFDVGHGGEGLVLYANDGRPDSFWGGDYRFVFRLRK